MVARQNIIAVVGSILLMFVTVAAADAQTQTDPLGLLNQRDTAQIPLLLSHEAGPITPAEEADGGIIWGPRSDVRAGLRVRLSTRGEHGAQFIFDVYLQNYTDRSLTVDCPSYRLSLPTDAGYITQAQSDRIYCVPTMQHSHGELVDIGVRQLTDKRRFTLAPGKPALISHWTIQTEHSRAQNSNKNGVTQAAHLSPGAYLMSCQINAEWNGQNSDLRTGKVPFVVLKTDVEDTRLPAHSP
jgi:hypothetical protein